MQALVVNLYIGVREFLSEHGFEGMCISEDVEKNNAKIAVLLLRVMVTLVQGRTNTVQPVNGLELGEVRGEEQRAENAEHVFTTATHKVHK